MELGRDLWCVGHWPVGPEPLQQGGQVGVVMPGCFGLLRLFGGKRLQGIQLEINTGDLAGRPKHRNRAPTHPFMAGVERAINGDAASSSSRERFPNSRGAGLLRLPSLLCVVFFLLVVQKLFIQPSVVS